MNTAAGILAGFLVIGGAVALYRFGVRTADALRRAIDEIRGGAEDDILEFERDPATGVYRSKAR